MLKMKCSRCDGSGCVYCAKGWLLTTRFTPALQDSYAYIYDQLDKVWIGPFQENVDVFAEILNRKLDTELVTLST